MEGRHLGPGLAILLALAGGSARASGAACWLDNGAVVVSAAFGNIAGDFIVDLSAPRSQLHVTAASSAGIESDSAEGRLLVAGMSLPGVILAITDLDARSAPFVTSINGVIGADVLAPFVVDIQPDPCRLTLYGKAPPRRAGAARLAVRRIDGVPAVTAGVSDGETSTRGWFALDTGFPGVEIAGARYTRPPPKASAAADLLDPPARLRALSLAGALFEQTPGGVWDQGAPGLDGAIGEAIWARYHLRLDMRAGWLDLAPAK